MARDNSIPSGFFVCFLNGLPLVVMEVKRLCVPARAAFDENLTSHKHPQNDTSALFAFNA